MKGKFPSKNDLLVLFSFVHCWYSPKMFCMSTLKFSRTGTLKYRKCRHRMMRSDCLVVGMRDCCILFPRQRGEDRNGCRHVEGGRTVWWQQNVQPCSQLPTGVCTATLHTHPGNYSKDFLPYITSLIVDNSCYYLFESRIKKCLLLKNGWKTLCGSISGCLDTFCGYEIRGLSGSKINLSAGRDRERYQPVGLAAFWRQF